MSADEEGKPTSLSPLLDSVAFRHRVVEEISRVRRFGGFLSLAVLASKSAAAAPDTLTTLAHRLRGAVRGHDQIAWRRVNVAILMPGTTVGHAERAAARFLEIAGHDDSGEYAAGVATIYGDAEGGADALLAAAEEALNEAKPRLVARSRHLDGRPRVLVVDDDREFAEALSDAITERGWDGHPCTQAADALNRIRNGSYAALFVDLVMPGRGGVELLHEAATHRPGMPAALMSGYDADGNAVLDALSLGPVTFIRKPISEGDLNAALEMFRQLLPGASRRQ